MSVIIIAGGDGRRAMRRFELAENLSGDQVTLVNDIIADLNKIADEMGCPPCDTEDGSRPAP